MTSSTVTSFSLTEAAKFSLKCFGAEGVEVDGGGGAKEGGAGLMGEELFKFCL